MTRDRTLIGSVVTLLAAVAVAQGIPINEAEQAALVDLGTTLVGTLAGLTAFARVLILRARSREAQK